jgi:hypothetical protein
LRKEYDISTRIQVNAIAFIADVDTDAALS